VLLLDGIFLHRPGLRELWDFSVILEVPFTVSVARMAMRDGTGIANPEDPSNRRYVEGQRRYLRECDPAGHATTVLDNADPARPVLLR
jgi:uridine kinase